MFELRSRAWSLWPKTKYDEAEDINDGVSGEDEFWGKLGWLIDSIDGKYRLGTAFGLTR